MCLTRNVVEHPDLSGEVSSSSPAHTKDCKNGSYCSSACAGYNEQKNMQLILYTMDLRIKVV